MARDEQIGGAELRLRKRNSRSKRGPSRDRHDPKLRTSGGNAGIRAAGRLSKTVSSQLAIKKPKPRLKTPASNPKQGQDLDDIGRAERASPERP